MLVEVPDSVPMDNWWIYGPARVGKSYYARSHFGAYYLKSHTVWWCDY